VTDPPHEYGLDGMNPSEGVVRAVSAHTDTEPTDLAPIAESIDPDALDALLASRDGTGDPVRVTFRFAAHEVTVVGGDRVQLRPLE
jgi:hypothetical protein